MICMQCLESISLSHAQPRNSGKVSMNSGTLHLLSKEEKVILKLRDGVRSLRKEKARATTLMQRWEQTAPRQSSPFPLLLSHTISQLHCLSFSFDSLTPPFSYSPPITLGFILCLFLLGSFRQLYLPLYHLILGDHSGSRARFTSLYSEGPLHLI